MITEDYVSFEIAKLLKEKGFDEPCYAEYYVPTKEFFHLEYEGNNNENYKEWITAPTLQMAMKWLRKNHNIEIVITPSIFWGKYNVSIYKKGNDYPFGFDGDSFCPSYEEACEAAIKYYLEHLI